jgi:hypothetical protein
MFAMKARMTNWAKIAGMFKNIPVNAPKILGVYPFTFNFSATPTN